MSNYWIVLCLLSPEFENLLRKLVSHLLKLEYVSTFPNSGSGACMAVADIEQPHDLAHVFVMFLFLHGKSKRNGNRNIQALASTGEDRL